jgi:hypothetical protein
MTRAVGSGWRGKFAGQDGELAPDSARPNWLMRKIAGREGGLAPGDSTKFTNILQIDLNYGGVKARKLCISAH